MRQRSYNGVALTGLAMALALSSHTHAQVPALPDAQIEANVLKSMAGAPQLANENIISNTVAGTVTLSGTVKDEATRVMAENLASRTDGVRKVIDQLQLVSPSDASQTTNPTLQSDGTMAPGQQHAPDPDTYAAQHGITGSLDQASGQSAPPDDSAMNNGQLGSQQPYDAQNGAGPDGVPQNGQSPQPNGSQYPNNQQQSYPQAQGPQGQQQPYPQSRPAYAPGQASYPQGGPVQQGPPPYGAQIAGEPITIPPGALIRIRINEGLDSKHSQPGTPFDAVVLNDVVAGGAVAIPRGASVQGTVIDSKSGGVIKGHGEIALQLHQVTLGGRTFPIASDIWSRDSSDKSGQTIGSAVGLGAFGALIGAVAGGGPGAAIGAVAGGAAGVGSSAASGSRQVMVPPEAIITFHLTQPASVTTISQAEMDRLSYGVPTGAQQSMRRREPPPYYGPVYYPRPYPYPY